MRQQAHRPQRPSPLEALAGLALLAVGIVAGAGALYIGLVYLFTRGARIEQVIP